MRMVGKRGGLKVRPDPKRLKELEKKRMEIENPKVQSLQEQLEAQGMSKLNATLEAKYMQEYYVKSTAYPNTLRTDRSKKNNFILTTETAASSEWPADKELPPYTSRTAHSLLRQTPRKVLPQHTTSTAAPKRPELLCSWHLKERSPPGLAEHLFAKDMSTYGHLLKNSTISRLTLHH